MTSTRTIGLNMLCAAALFALPTGCVNAQLGGKTGANGMTLYTFDKDQGTESACYDDCATNWPPYLAKEGVSKGEGWATTDRKDGTKQWTYNGHPLYYYIEDKAAGDRKGDGKGGVWHVVQ
jgi:predicted lipoprotein with Yx(FWY)xxD motif